MIRSTPSFVRAAISHSGAILPGQSLTVLVTYAIGDLIGLMATTFILMLVFRWIRLASV